MRISDLDTRSAALGESTAYFAVDQASSNVTHKIDYNALARAIIEQYTGSTIGGAAQSVKAALDTVISGSYGLSYNTMTAIVANADLDSFTAPGNYVSKSSIVTNTLLNCPVTGTGFSLHIESTSGGSGQYIQQTLIRQASILPETYYRCYNGSTWGSWVQQPTRAEMGALTTATPVSTGINGLFAFKMGSIVWIRMYDCAYDISGTLPESLRPKNGVHFCAVSGSADRKVALVSINVAGEVDVNSQITSGYIYGGAVYMV